MISVPVARSLVAGDWRDGTPAPDINPAHPEQFVAEIRLASADLASEAVSAAHLAFHRWSRTPATNRGDILRRAGDLLESRAATIGRELTLEEGKTLAEAVGETKRAAAILRYFAGQALEPDGETYPSASPTTLLFARRHPLGAVVVITPWNFPIAIPAWKIAPALAYGNTVVWKPAELTPLTSVRLVEALLDAGLPEGVLNLVIGRGSEVGDVLSGHRDAAAISFTGSNSVGRAIQRLANDRGAKVQLELGGKNPAIVLHDADLDHAVLQVAKGAFLSAGQKCTATSRVIVETAVAGPFLERLTSLADSWDLGDPLDPQTKVGPLVSKEALRSVQGFLSEGLEDGGHLIAGTREAGMPKEGYFVRPTVIAGLTKGSRLLRDEIFGPVAAVIEAGDFDEAVALANDTDYGLSASIFTRDLNAALRFAEEVKAGVVKVNQESAGIEFQAPFGGMKQSSSGSREQGKVARDFFTEWKTVYLDRSS